MPAPAEYYTSRLVHMIAWVRCHHGRLVDRRLERWMARFDALPDAARHLLVRLLLRRGPDFRIDAFAYPGVDDARRASLTLALGGFAALVTDRTARIAALRVPELREALVRLGARPASGMRRSALAADLLAVLGAHGGGEAERTASLPLLLRLCCSDELDCLRLLYFGTLRQDLKAFIVADVGALRWPAVALDPRLPFAEAGEVRRAVALHHLADLVSGLHHADREVRDAICARHLDHLCDALANASCCPHTEGRRARALLRIAAIQEARGRRCAQLRALRRSGVPPARERACRLLARAGRPRAAERLRRAMLRTPLAPEERSFAERFDARAGRCRPRRSSGGAVPVRRLRLRGPAPALGVEARIAGLFAAAGNRVLHLENRLPGMLFALGFWDIVFAPMPGAFVQPFQSGPTDLHAGGFRARREGAVSSRLEAMAADRFGVTDFLAVLERERGRVNAFWGWQEAEIAGPLLHSLPPALRAGICDIVASEPARARSGFPDLFVGNGEPGCCAFIEVKGPGDRLREGQRRWIEDLRRLGAAAEVLEVRW